ncbi:MAG TPA: hypothetical protein VK903_02110 [Propionicimonas sp.]|nr:hypothetical protein [Propionicimonas sp.]
MTATLWSTSNPPMLSEPSDLGKARLTVVPWSKFGTRRLYVDTVDGQHVGWVDLKTGHRSLAMPEHAPAFEVAVSGAITPRRALEEEIEAALIAGHAALHGQDSAPEPDKHAEEPASMRHAYRGTKAYSDWDLSPRGKRLLEDELEQLAEDPRWAYQNSSVGN